jgi:hypothetical protein
MARLEELRQEEELMINQQQASNTPDTTKPRRHDMARIRKHRNKWQVLYRDPATKKERSAGVFDRKSDATKQKRAVEYKLQTGEWIDPALQSIVYADWVATWLSTKAHLKPKTVAGYESLFDSQILPQFGSAKLRDIKAIDVEQWISDMRSRGLSVSRARQARSLLSSTLRAAVRNQMIPSNPARRGVNPTGIEKRDAIPHTCPSAATR